MPTTKSPLGQGLAAILGDDADGSQASHTVKLAHIDPNREQPRKRFDEEQLSELADSITKNGIITPLTLRRVSADRYQIIAGERRWRAAKIAGLTEVPAYVLEADDMRTLELALVENLQREDLNPIEEAEGFSMLIERYGMTQEKAAQSVSKSRPAVANTLRLLDLPSEVQDMVRAGVLSGGHARTLLPLGGKKAILAAARTVADGQLSVRNTEKLVKSLLAERDKPAVPAQKPLKIDYARELGVSLAKSLGRGVKVEPIPKKGKVGKVILEYYDHEDLDRLLAILTRE